MKANEKTTHNIAYCLIRYQNIIILQIKHGLFAYYIKFQSVIYVLITMATWPL